LHLPQLTPTHQQKLGAVVVFVLVAVAAVCVVAAFAARLFADLER
jgi:hypothetical protein